VIAALAALLLAIRPEGGQFRVNTYTTGNQYRPAVAAAPSGAFVVAWHSPGVSEDQTGIQAQQFNAAGTPQGSQFRVNTYTTGDQFDPTVAADAFGAFVVSWASNGAEDGSLSAVFARLYDSGGTPRGNPFRVNQATAGFQEKPSAAMDPTGMFTVAWESDPGSAYAVYVRPYRALGAASAPELALDSFAAGAQKRPALAGDATGGFVVAWSGYTSEAAGYDIYAHKFHPGFTNGAGDLLVNTSTTGTQSFPAVSMNPAGGFVVAWSNGATYPDVESISARLYDAAGQPTTAELRVNGHTSPVARPAALALPDGSFVVVYGSEVVNAATDLFLRKFDATGAPVGAELRVNTSTAGIQRKPRIAGHAKGFIVVWESEVGDGSGWGIFAQRYSTKAVSGDVDGDGDADVGDVFYLINFLFAGGPAPVG
jgi:hypothetical protein